MFKFKISSVKEYRKFVKTKKFQKLNIPKHPNQTYARQNKWKGWGDFLGTGNIYKGNYWSFYKTRRFVRKLKLNSVAEWSNYCKTNEIPKGIPVGLHSVYNKHKNWKGFPNFIGSSVIDTKIISELFYDFSKAKSAIKKYRINNSREWRAFLKSGRRPSRIPAAPDRVYKNKGWKGWPDF